MLSRFPAFRISILCSAGIIAGRQLDVGFSLSALTTLTLLVAASVLFFFSRKSAALHTGSMVLFAMLCVALGATKVIHDYESSFIPPDDLLRKDVVVIGRVIEDPSTAGNRTRFVLEGREVVDASGASALPVNILVTYRILRRDTVAVPLEYGTTVALRGKLERPTEERNPGEFNARQYYEANGISLFLHVMGVDHVAVLQQPSGSWLMREVVLPVRRYILRLIDLTIGGEEGEFLKGIFIGEQTGLSPETREAFTNAGVAHVLAVSGSNVAVVVGLLFLMLDFLRLPKPARLLVTSAGIILYMLLTGSQPPVVRATIMALVFLLAGALQEKNNGLNSLGVAALIVLGIDARQMYDVGFQLSFSAVFAIIYLYPKTDAWIRLVGSETRVQRAIVWTLRVCAVSAVATLGTLPLTAIYFGRVSIVGLLANIIVIPAVGLGVTLGVVSSLAGVMNLWLAEVYAAVNHVLLSWTLRFTNAAGGLSFATIDTMRFTALDSLPFYCGLALLFHLNMKSVARKLFIVFLIALNVSVFAEPATAYQPVRDKLRVSFIDVGQGDAVLAEFPDGKTMLVDAGPASMSYDAGRRIVAPFLKRRGISVIDLLVVSHAHSDHVGGVPAVLREFDVRKVVDAGQAVRSRTYFSYLKHVQDEQCVLSPARLGMLMTDFPKARVYTLYPTPTFLISDTSMHHPNLNNTSVVLKLHYGGVSFLFAGDAESEAEEEMVSVYGTFLNTTVLKVGHHGSITSSTQQFLDEVRPEFAVISVGRNNKFNHPSPVVLDRLAAMNIMVSRTDEEGAIIFETDGRSITRVDWK